MQVIGFNFKKILATRPKLLIKPSIDTNIEFINLEKASLDLLKDSDALTLDFRYTITYQNPEDKNKKKEEVETGQINFEGNLILALSKNDAKELLKLWKKKKIPQQTQIPLYNIILRKCTPKAVQLAEEISLPSPIPLPKLSQAQNQPQG